MVNDGGLYHTKNKNNIYGASIYYIAGPKYRIIAFISAGTDKLSVIA